MVWISPKAGAPHDVRVEVSKGPRVHSADMISVAIRPDVRVVGGGTMNAQELALLRKWVELNRDVLVRFWDALVAVRPEYAFVLFAYMNRT